MKQGALDLPTAWLKTAIFMCLCLALTLLVGRSTLAIFNAAIALGLAVSAVRRTPLLPHATQGAIMAVGLAALSAVVFYPVAASRPNSLYIIAVALAAGLGVSLSDLIDAPPNA